MEVIAKTQSGFLISATTQEIKEIVSSVTGERSKDINVGQKVPAIDYASTIKKVKSLADDYDFIQIFQNLANFSDTAEELKKSVDAAGKISI